MLHVLGCTGLTILVIDFTGLDERLGINNGKVPMEWRLLVLEQSAATLNVAGLLTLGFFRNNRMDLAFWITGDLPRIDEFGQFLSWFVLSCRKLIMELVIVGSQET